MAYEIIIEKKALKTFGKLEKSVQLRITKYLDKVAISPLIYGDSLHGSYEGLVKYRVGNYRLICEVQHEILIIHVIKIGHRREVYNQ